MTESNDRFTGTRPVDERLSFDVGRLETWMREHVEDFPGGLSAAQFKGGQSNPTYLLSAGQRRGCCGASRRASSWPRPMRSTGSTA